MNEDDSVSPRDWRDRPAKSPEEVMKNEIKPMSAEDILEEFDNIFPEKHWLRNALAAYTKFLLEKVPNDLGKLWRQDMATTYRVGGRKEVILEVRSLLQDQIDQLTK